MAQKIIVTAHYPGDADEVFDSALDFAEMAEAMAGLATYEGLPGEKPKEGETFSVDVTLWGFVKNKGHVMHIEKLDRAGRSLQSREHNPAIPRWDHHLAVYQEGPDRVRWVDTIIIEAGWRSAFVARFCAFVYQRRHKKRQAQSIETRICNA